MSVCVCLCPEAEPVCCPLQVVKVGGGGASTANRAVQTRRHAPGLGSQLAELEQEAWPKASSYHVRGAVNQVYSEILLSRLCPSG